MPITLSIDHARRRIRALAKGPVTTAHVAQFFSDRVSAGAEEYDLIVEASAVQLMVDEADLRPLTNDRNAALGGRNPGLTAWVAPTAEQFERAQSFRAALAKLGVPVSIFTSLAEATKWLDESRATRR